MTGQLQLRLNQYQVNQLGVLAAGMALPLSVVLMALYLAGLSA